MNDKQLEILKWFRTLPHAEVMRKLNRRYGNFSKKRPLPDIPTCVMIHNKYPKARDGMKKILTAWGLGDDKRVRQPDYMER